MDQNDSASLKTYGRLKIWAAVSFSASVAMILLGRHVAKDGPVAISPLTAILVGLVVLNLIVSWLACMGYRSLQPIKDSEPWFKHLIAWWRRFVWVCMALGLILALSVNVAKPFYLRWKQNRAANNGTHSNPVLDQPAAQ